MDDYATWNAAWAERTRNNGATAIAEEGPPPCLAAPKSDKPPLCTGLLDYFPLALAEVAKVSVAGNEQYNAGEPLHWAREKSPDHANGLLRHWILRGDINPESGVTHTAHAAWRALAFLQLELEAAG